MRVAKVASRSKESGRRGSAPGERRGGRKKGTPNKLTADVRAAILGALEEVGGQRYLVVQAHENPVAFMTLLGKCLPKVVTGEDGKDLLPRDVTIRFVGP